MFPCEAYYKTIQASPPRNVNLGKTSVQLRQHTHWILIECNKKHLSEKLWLMFSAPRKYFCRGEEKATHLSILNSTSISWRRYIILFSPGYEWATNLKNLNGKILSLQLLCWPPMPMHSETKLTDAPANVLRISFAAQNNYIPCLVARLMLTRKWLDIKAWSGSTILLRIGKIICRLLEIVLTAFDVIDFLR